MNLSNYPPGVTGNEPQIAGYDSVTKSMTCTWVTEHGDGEEIDCDFAGEVDIEFSGQTGYWVCPTCGHEHEVDMEAEFGPDPDEDWDSRYDRD